MFLADHLPVSVHAAHIDIVTSAERCSPPSRRVPSARSRTQRRGSNIHLGRCHTQRTYRSCQGGMNQSYIRQEPVRAFQNLLCQQSTEYVQTLILAHSSQSILCAKCYAARQMSCLPACKPLSKMVLQLHFALVWGRPAAVFGAVLQGRTSPDIESIHHRPFKICW